MARVSWVVMAVAFGVVSCGAREERPAVPAPAAACEPMPLEVLVGGGPLLNATGSEGVPVELRIHELRSGTRLSNVSLAALWADSGKALGPDLLATHELIVYPSEAQRLELTLVEQTRVLGVVANFREPSGRDWAMTFEVDPVRKPPCDQAPSLSLWVDRMKIQDGAGRVDAAAARGHVGEVR